MKIIDPETGKRVLQKGDKIILPENDMLKRNVEKDLEMDEHSPMDPPGAFNAAPVEGVMYEQYDRIMQNYMDEHRVCISQIDAFEKALVKFKENQYQLNDSINSGFSTFFQFFDNSIVDHNQREEKQLFPLLHKRLIEAGEAGKGSDPSTAVDMMEDDHHKFIQLATLTFNMLGLAARLPDPRSKMFVFDTAYNNGRELIELLRLHIYREDNILFPLAQKLLSQEDFDTIHRLMK